MIYWISLVLFLLKRKINRMERITAVRRRTQILRTRKSVGHSHPTDDGSTISFRGAYVKTIAQDAVRFWNIFFKHKLPLISIPSKTLKKAFWSYRNAHLHFENMVLKSLVHNLIAWWWCHIIIYLVNLQTSY